MANTISCTSYSFNFLNVASSSDHTGNPWISRPTLFSLISIKHLGMYAASSLFRRSSAKLTPTRPAPIIAILIFWTSLSFPFFTLPNIYNKEAKNLPWLVSLLLHLYAYLYIILNANAPKRFILLKHSILANVIFSTGRISSKIK